MRTHCTNKDTKSPLEAKQHGQGCACVCVPSRFSRVQFFATLWTVTHQAPPSMGFSRQEYWSGLPFPSPGDLPHPGMEPAFLVSPALAGKFFTTVPPGNPRIIEKLCQMVNGYLVTNQT